MRSANNVSETTTSIAGSNGDGAVTLTQRTSLPRYSTIYGTSARVVRYVIRQSDNTKFETGIGSMASNVLTRTLPLQTWDGTTWDDSSPAAIQFGSSPTSGSVLVEICALAENTGGNIMDVRQSALTPTSWTTYALSAHQIGYANGTGWTLTADREYAAPYRLDVPGRLTGAQFEVTTAVASSELKWALFEPGSNGFPANKLVNFTTTSCATTGIKTDTAFSNIYLTPGWYYVNFISGHTPSLRVTGSNLGAQNPLGRADGYGSASKVYVSGNFTTGLTDPGSFAGGTLDTGIRDVWFGLRVQP